MQLHGTCSTLRSRLGGTGIGDAVKGKCFILPAPASHSTLDLYYSCPCFPLHPRLVFFLLPLLLTPPYRLVLFLLPLLPPPTLTFFCRYRQRPSDSDIFQSRYHSVCIFSRQALWKSKEISMKNKQQHKIGLHTYFNRQIHTFSLATQQ